VNRVLVIGGINLDLVFRAPHIPAPGETAGGATLARFPGGKGANQAVAAARAGARVTLLGAVGTDEAGEYLLSTLRAAGVDVRHVARDATGHTGTAAIVVDRAGRNAIALAQGANLSVDAAAARAAVQAAAPDVVLANREVTLAGVDAALRAAPAALRVLNASPLAGGEALALDDVDVLLVNELEAGFALGREVTVADAPAASADLARRVRRGCVLTLGGAGYVAAVDGRTVVRPAHVVEVVDTTGAGDAFAGAFAAALAAGCGFAEALAWANAAGALATTKAGAQPSMPAAADIAALVRTTLA